MSWKFTLIYNIRTNDNGELSFVETCLEHPGENVVSVSDLFELSDRHLHLIHETCLNFELYEFIPYVLKEMQKRKISPHR